MKTNIEKIINDFFKWLQINIKDLVINCEDEERNIYFIKIETDDSKLLIWTHGQTLESIKHLLSRMLENSIHDNIVIHLEVNDYMKSKDDKLYRYIDWRIDYVVKSQKEISLPNFSSYERKKIHSYISEKNISNIRSYSVGEWKDRVMHLAPASKISKDTNFDLDWTDI